MTIPSKQLPRKVSKTQGQGSESKKLGLALGWLFIVGAIVVIVLLVMRSKPESRLVCNNDGAPPSLIHFGRCHEE